MATAGEVARAALAAVGSDANLLLATQWVSERYVQMVGRVKFRHLRRYGELVVPAMISAGTATATRDSAIVTGDATAAAAWATTDLKGRFFQGRTAWYEIAETTGAPAQLRLTSPFAEDTVTAGSYRLVQRYATLDRGARFFRGFTAGRLWRPITTIPLEALDRLAPGRPYLGSLAVGGWVSDVGWSTALNTRRIELYPYSTTSEIICYLWWSAPADLDFDDDIPGPIDSYLLKDGALIDVFRHKASVAADQGKVDMAAFWRNESRAQETVWERRIGEATRQDRGTDDTTFLLASADRRGSFRDVVTARDQVLATGNRP